MSGLYQRTTQSLEGLTDVEITNIQNGQAPVYDATSQVYTNQTVLTQSDLPSGSSGDVIISNGTGGIESTINLNVNPSNGNITGSYVNVSSSTIKLGSGALTATDAVGIGWNAGLGASNKSVSIGTVAGGSAGESSVSLGFNAKADDANCIVINATGALLESGTPSSFNIAPVRNVNATTLLDPYVVQYDEITKEMFKSEDLHIRDILNRNIQNGGTLTNVSTASLYNGQLTAGIGGNKIVAGAGNNNLVVDLTNQRVGINNVTPTTTFQVGTTMYVNDTNKRVGIGIANPEEDLEVDGSIQIDSANVARLKFQQSGQNPHALSEIDGEQDGTNGGDLQFLTKVDGGSVTEKLRINNVGAIGIGGINYGLPNQVLTSNGATGAVSWTTPTAPPPGAFGVFYVDGALTIPVNTGQQVNNLVRDTRFPLTGMSILGKQTGNTAQTITVSGGAGNYLFTWTINAQQLSGSTINVFELYQGGSRLNYNWYIFSGLENIVGSFMVNQTTANQTYSFLATATGGGHYRLNGFNNQYTQISITKLF